MFKHCPKIDKMCGFCGENDWNPMEEESRDKTFLFCGLASGYETRVEPLPKCWKEMSNSERGTYKKKKKEEYFTLNPGKLINNNTVRYSKS